MTRRQVIRAISCFAAVAAMVVSTACTKPPTAPTAIAGSTTSLVISGLASGATLASCLGGSGDPACFGDARMHSQSVVSSPLTSAPLFNNGQSVLNSSTTVTLQWTAPASGVATSYLIEASSSPGGPSNLASLDTGGPSTTLVVPAVPPGTYFVRVRALDATGASAPSNEVQVVVGAAPGGGGGGGGSCPSAPQALTLISQNAGTVTLGWQVPASGTASSYVIQAGSTPGAANLANTDNGAATTLVAPGVPNGTYYVRVYARNNACAAPQFLGPASNELVFTIGAAGPSPNPGGWAGQIVCRTQISGPNGYGHQETQTWNVGGVGQVSGPRTDYPTQWSAQGSGGGPGRSWTINSTSPMNMSVTVLPTGVPIIDRTTSGLVIRGGIVGTPTSFDLYEMEFPTIVASGPGATSVSGTWSRPTVGGDSPQQPGLSNGTLTCTWSLSR